MKKQAKQARRIRTGDTVVITAGNDRGKTGQVLKRVGNDKVLVQGINVCKKATRRSEANPQGGFIEFERPIHASNVLPATENGKGFRLKARIADGTKQLYGVVDGSPVEYRTLGKSGNKSES